MLRIQRSMRTLDQPTRTPTSRDTTRSVVTGLALLGLMALGLVANAGLLAA